MDPPASGSELDTVVLWRILKLKISGIVSVAWHSRAVDPPTREREGGIRMHEGTRVCCRVAGCLVPEVSFPQLVVQPQPELLTTFRYEDIVPYKPCNIEERCVCIDWEVGDRRGERGNKSETEGARSGSVAPQLQSPCTATVPPAQLQLCR